MNIYQWVLYFINNILIWCLRPIIKYIIIKKKIKEDEIFEIAISAGAKDCSSLDEVFEIITEKEDFYKIKTELEKKVESFQYSSIEWRPLNYLDFSKDRSKQILEVLTALEELDDVQNIYTNANLKNLQLWKLLE